MKAKNFGIDWLEIDLPFPCEIHHCYPRATPVGFSVLLHSGEPSALKWSNDDVIRYHKNFDLILTSEKTLLHLSNSELFIFGDAWVNGPPSNKSFEVSYLYSAGCGLEFEGYELRNKVWAIQSLINVPRQFWLSARRTPIVNNTANELYPFPTKDPLFNSMFSICIENVSEENYFTEKILDAFRSYTIPLYYGCPNIGDFFDNDGIICFNSAFELIDIVNNLSPKIYWDKLGSQLSNNQRSNLYISPLKRITDLILKFHMKSTISL